MADSEDLKRLESGELDLSRCDFREANLKGMDLRGRDFTYSLFAKAQCEGTQFSGSDFRNAQIGFIKARNAVFDRCKLERLHFGYPDLSGASLVDVMANGAKFQHANLKGANLRGATIRNGSVDADTTLEGVISNDRTDFEGLEVLRPTSRDALFKDYVFNNGKLRRQSTIAVAETNDFIAPIDKHNSGQLPPSEGSKIKTAEVQIQHLMRNAVVTRLTAQQFASQIEDALRGVTPENGNELAEPLQTMLEFAEVLRNLAPDSQLPAAPLDREQLEQRIAQLEELVEHLTQQLDDKTKALEAVEALKASEGFMASFRKSAGLAAGGLAVTAVAAVATVGVPTAAVYFLGAEHPLVNSYLTVMGKLPN